MEKSPFGPSILAWLVTWKFLHHLPVYRQQELLLGPLKRWLSRALLCGLLGRTALALRPLERLIRQEVLAGVVINADETEVRMLKPGNGKTVSGYVTGYAGDAAHPFVFYDFRPSRSRDGPTEVLTDYGGYLQTDGYIVYTSLVRASAGRLVDVWPYLTDVLRRLPEIAPTDTAALEALLPNRWVAAHPEHRLEQRAEESRDAQARRRRRRAARRVAAVP